MKQKLTYKDFKRIRDNESDEDSDDDVEMIVDDVYVDFIKKVVNEVHTKGLRFAKKDVLEFNDVKTSVPFLEIRWVSSETDDLDLLHKLFSKTRAA